MLPTSQDKTIAQAKNLLSSGKSVKVINMLTEVVFIITLKIPPPIADHNNRMTFDISNSILQNIRSQYIRKKIVDLLNPIKKEQFRYALKVFFTDNEYIDVMNNDIIKQIRPFSKTPKKYRMMNLFHILFTGLQNEDIIELLTDSDFDLGCTIQYKNNTYRNVNLLMAEMEFNKIMQDDSKDLPDIKVLDGNFTLYFENDFFIEPWENFVKFYARRYKITMIPILNDRQQDKELEIEIKENFIDLRLACQTNDAFIRVL